MNNKPFTFIVIICFLFFASTVYSQTPAVKLNTNANDTLTIREMISIRSDGIGEGITMYKILGKSYAYEMTEVDTIPQFPGGMDKLKDTINSRAKAIYPEGRRGFIIRFVIGYAGELTNLSCFGSGYAGIDRKLIKFIRSLPKWTPGIKDNKYVRVKLDLLCRPF